VRADFKHCSLEMGGKNIIIVMETRIWIWPWMGGVGRVWHHGSALYGGSRFGVHKSVYKEFVERFVSRVKALKVGDGLDPNTDVGPCINEQQLKR